MRAAEEKGMMSITTGTVIPTPKEARMRQMISPSAASVDVVQLCRPTFFYRQWFPHSELRSGVWEPTHLGGVVAEK